MGWLVIVLIIGALWFFGFLAREQKAKAEAEVYARYLRESQFQVYASEESKSFEDQSINVFSIEIKGAMNAPYADYPYNQEVSIRDVTEEEETPKPLLCMIEDLQYADTQVFNYISPTYKLPYENSIMNDWLELLSVPVGALIFPLRGTRKLKFFVFIKSAVDEQILAGANYTITYENEEPGYLDLKADRERAEVLTAQLAVAVSASDGSLTESEGKIVGDWMRKSISIVDEDDQPSVRSRLNKTVSRAITEYESGKKLDVDNICMELKKIASTAEIYSALDLCLKVAKADDLAADRELKLLTAMADKLGVRKDRFRAMTDKILPVSMHEILDKERLLGICSDMSKQQRKQHLIKEYKKWNRRVTHSDKNVRKQAEEMLRLIAEARSMLDNEPH